VFVREKQGATDLFLVPVAPVAAPEKGADPERSGAAAPKEPLDPERRLTDSPDRAERNPRFSPDGERIAFVAGPADLPSIVVIDRQGQVLFETPGHSPTWAPPFPDEAAPGK